MPIPRRSVVLSVVALSTVACAVDPMEPLEPPAPTVQRSRSIDVASIKDEGELLGVSIDGDRFDVLVAGIGIVQIDREGREQARFTVGERGLWEMPYKDVASQGDGQFVLLADSEGYLYDAVTEQQRVHFCVEPDMEPEPGEPTLVQRNDAVAQQGDVIVAAPRFYDDATGALVESSLRTYAAADGIPTGAADLTATGVELFGITLHDDSVWGVSGGALHRFSMQGERLGDASLQDVQRATGISIDPAAREAWVIDAEAARLAVFALDDLTGP